MEGLRKSFDVPWLVSAGASEGEGYFFSLRRAPATGRRRRAGSGYWKATGKEKPVFLQCGSRRQLLVGVKTALAFHRSEPSSSSRTGWVMHEYRLAVPGGVAVAEQRKNANHDRVAEPGEWVVCRVSLKNRPRSRPNRDGDSKTPGNRTSMAHRAPPLHHREDDGRQPPMSPQLSSSSCVTGVTDIADQDEVSSSSISIRDAPADSQREA
ncbi:NAC domain-containing protein 41-like [Panicum miliaceum]|uniref:NAC domain-containing protein 41-like n=1 Tax=Panicum miliaceum TaxID=4540 RepID=A0A3L6T9J5_PANMI|nr:NAC domain-containing protein 41-like [Panicum miliaceum]